MPDTPPVPNPTIFLRDDITIRANLTNQFLNGKEDLLRNTFQSWELIASCAERKIFRNTNTSEPLLRAMQVWRLKDWPSLYNSISTFSDTGWYLSLGSSLASENQDFLVGVLGGGTLGGRDADTPVSPTWSADDDPGYCYLFEHALPRHGFIHSYLRHLNWFADQMIKYKWDRVWSALQVTAAPSAISVLWKIRGDVQQIENDIRALQAEEVGATRYAEMMGCLETLSRRTLYPAYPERIAQLLVEDARPISDIPRIVPPR